MTTRHEDSPRQALTRRETLKMGLWGLGITALGPLQRAAAAVAARPRAQEPFLIVVELEGGNDALNTVVPTTLAQYGVLRPQLALTPAEALALDTGPAASSLYRLHPSLANMATMYRNGEVAVIHKVGYPDANLSHFQSKDIWATGARNFTPGNKVGWIARYAEQHAPTSLGAVAVGRGNHLSLRGGGTKPLTLAALSQFQFYTDNSYGAHHGARMNLIRRILDESAATGVSGSAKAALDQGHALADQLRNAVLNYTSPVTYDTASFSQRMKDIAILLQAGFETRIFYTGFGGFDTHGSQGKLTGRHPDLLLTLDEALFSFSEDCKQMGIWNQCVIAVVSEFGRRNYENGSGGTDHGGGNCVLLLGGGVQPGMYGADLTEADLTERFLPYEVDFRDVYAELLEGHLGVADAAPIFPEVQGSAPLGLV